MPKGIKGFQKGYTPWNKDTHIQSNTGRTCYKKGHFVLETIREKISDGHKGMKKPWANPPHYRGEKHYNWKGSEVGYGALHAWIRNRLGRPKICKHCGKPAKHWANKSGNYLRNLKDWISLCVSCHKIYDKK